jgi:hypothetical protein
VGKPPVTTIFITQEGGFSSLTEEQIADNSASTIHPTYSLIWYTLPYYYAVDWIEARNQAANDPNVDSDPFLHDLVTMSFPGVEYGTYKINVKYVLPGKHLVSSEKIYSFPVQ